VDLPIETAAAGQQPEPKIRPVEEIRDAHREPFSWRRPHIGAGSRRSLVVAISKDSSRAPVGFGN
jgi:hypothetical protein